MDLVYDIYLIFTFRGRIFYFFTYFSDIVDTVVGCGVYFDYVYASALICRPAELTFVTWLSVVGIKTVYGLGKYFRRRSFSCSPCAAKKVCVRNTSAFYLIFKCFYYMLLADHIFKCLRPEFSVKSLIRGHIKSLPSAY